MDTITLSIKEKVREFILKTTLADKTKILDESLIFKEGFFDSMGFVMILTFMDETFGVKANDADLIEENFESINAISEFISRKKNN
jgi:acyl carrier protein